MAELISGNAIGRALASAGLLPPECSDVKIMAPADGVLVLQYRINVTRESARAIAQALLEASVGEALLPPSRLGNSALCHLCQCADGTHWPECDATPDGAIPLGEGPSWRHGVLAARAVQLRLQVQP